MDPATITATIAAIASSVGLLVTSLRKRQDTTYEELQSAKKNLQGDVTRLEGEVDKAEERYNRVVDLYRSEQDHNLRKDQIIATLRRELAKVGIADPTVSNDQGA